MNELTVGQEVYWARIIPNVDVFDLYDLKVVKVADTYFVCTDDQTKQSYLFNEEDLNDIVYTERGFALEHLKDAQLQKGA